MQISIDDSGSCSIGNLASDAFGIDCVAAVVLTDKAAKLWEARYASLGKGKDLDEDQSLQVIDFLVANGAQAFVSASNCNAVSKKIVLDHCANYCVSIADILKNQREVFRASGERHIEILKSLSPPLYIKTMLIIHLIENVIRGVLGRMQFYQPENFNEFEWFCDDVPEKSHSIIRHLIHLQINSHAAGEAISVSNSRLIPKYVREHQGIKYLDVTKVLQNFSFQPDENCAGIKAADCIANFFRRIFKGHLKLSRVDGLKQLFSSSHSVDLLHFNKDEPFFETQLDEYASFVLNEISNQNKIISIR
jgi:hypothetical protein